MTAEVLTPVISPESASQSATTYRRHANWVFTSYRVLSRSYFHLPVLWVWLAVEQGISVWGVAVLLALYSGTLTFEAPLAQRLRRRPPPGRSIVLGDLLAVLGTVNGAAVGLGLLGLGAGSRRST